MRVQPLCRFAQQEGPHNFSSYRYRHLVIVVSLILLAFCGPVAALALSWHDGEGPYYISTAEELAELASLVNGGNNFSGRAIRLSEDIDLSGYENWTPIGSSLTQFLGEFDGREHAVFNMKAVGGVNTGLFGYAGNGAKIRNLDLVDFSIQSTSSSSNNTGVGCLVGYNGGAVENVSSNGVITGSGYIGGLVGWNSVAGTVSNSNARVEVTGTSTTGGLVGQNYGVISDCAATGSAASTGNGAGIGGLVGANNGVYSKISNSATNTRVKGGTLANIGGLAGYNGGYVSGSAANGEVGVSGAFESPKAGGLVGDNIGSVADSAASGNITVAISIKTYDTHIGGLIGDNKSESKSHYIVSNNATSGNVSVNYGAGSSRMYVGGFIGNNESGILSRDNVYDRQAAAQNAGMGYNVNASGGVKGATTAELTPSPQDASSNLGDSWTASKWTFFQGHYPQPRPLAESANPLARRISAIASAPVLFGNSTDTSRNMTVPFRVPRATAGTLHANLQWTQDEQRALKFYSKSGDDKYWHAGWGQLGSDREVALTATDALGCTKEFKLTIKAGTTAVPEGAAPLSDGDKSPDPPMLTGLTISKGSLTPAFNRHVAKYWGHITGSSGESVEITAAATTGSAIKIRGAEAVSENIISIPLNIGKNMVAIEVNRTDPDTGAVFEESIYSLSLELEDVESPSVSVASPGSGAALDTRDLSLAFSETVTAIPGGKVAITGGGAAYSYEIPNDPAIISGTGTACRAVMPLSSFYNGGASLALAAGKSYVVGVSSDAFQDLSGKAVQANLNVGSFSTAHSYGESGAAPQPPAGGDNGGSPGTWGEPEKPGDGLDNSDDMESDSDTLPAPGSSDTPAAYRPLRPPSAAAGDESAEAVEQPDGAYLIMLPAGSDITSVDVTIEIPDGATITPSPNGVDFSGGPVTFMIAMPDGTAMALTIIVKVGLNSGLATNASGGGCAAGAAGLVLSSAAMILARKKRK